MVIIKRASNNNNKLSKSKEMIGQISFRILQKITLQKNHVILNWKENVA